MDPGSSEAYLHVQVSTVKRANVCGRRICKIRKERGIDQVDLAAALCVDFGLKLEQSDISEIERGVRGLKDFELDAIANVLDISPTWLLRGEEDA